MLENQEISGLPENCNSPIYTSPFLPLHQSALDATPPTCFTRRASEKTPHSGPYGVTLPALNETNMAQAQPRGHMYLRPRHPNIAVSRGKLGRGHVWPRNCGIGSPLASDLGSIFRARETRLFANRRCFGILCCRAALPCLRGSSWWWSRTISGTCWSSVL